MRRLWLLRHAKSSWDEHGLPDHERPLAPRGRRATEAVARHLEANEIRPGLVVCSTARRARETLAGVLPALGTGLTVRFDDAVYTFDHGELLTVVREVPDDQGSVLLVGHNPALERLAAELAREGPRLADLREKYPTGALAGLDLEVDAWADAAPACARLTSFVTPRELGA
jgi:phosphohistidine phosphatase